MSKHILLLSLLSLYASVSAQNGDTNSSDASAFFGAILFNKNTYKTQERLYVSPMYLDSAKFKSRYLVSKKDRKMYTVVPDTGDFIRYKVLKSEDDHTYIRILKGCHLDTVEQEIRISEDAKNPAEHYVFRIDSALTPLNHYLASSALVGMPLTLPLKVRRLNGEAEFTGSFNISYAFGWKLKVGNHPFRSHYFHIIPYAAGISVQKYFFRKEDGTFSDKKDELALTYYSGGITYQWDKLNIGLFLGFDRMLNQDNWVYDDRGWLGLGVGYDLFKQDK